MSNQEHIEGRPERRESSPEALAKDHLMQLAWEHKETQRRWRAEQGGELDTDPERARKLAAIRTEMRNRHIDGQRGQ